MTTMASMVTREFDYEEFISLHIGIYVKKCPLECRVAFFVISTLFVLTEGRVIFVPSRGFLHLRTIVFSC